MKIYRASGILKLMAVLRSMAKSKALALKSKTNAIKARLVIFSLVMNKRYVMSILSDKFQSLLGGHHSHLKEVKDDTSVENMCNEVVNENAHLHHEAVSNINSHSETQIVVEDKDDDDDGCECCYMYDDGGSDGDGGKYPDLTHTMFESEDLDLGGSVIDLVKSSKEEAGEEFKMEEEIDHMADLFIKKFRRQIMLQRQDSMKRQHDEMVLK